MEADQLGQKSNLSSGGVQVPQAAASPKPINKPNSTKSPTPTEQQPQRPLSEAVRSSLAALASALSKAGGEGGGMRYATFLAHRGVVMKEYGEDGGRREKDVEGAWKELIPEGSGWVGQLEGCLSAEEAANVLEADSNTFQKFPEWKRRALRRKALLYLFS